MPFEGDDFIRRYIRYTENQESPLAFHQWIATGLIGSASARNTYLDMGYFKVYPNNYLILVAGSAKCRKSVAIEIGIKLFSEALPERVVLSEKITPEALTRQLSKVETEGKGKDQRIYSKPTVLYSDELGVFLSRAAQQAGMPLLLTRLYSCPDKFEYITKGQGTDKLREVCVNLFAATTPSWLQRAVGPDVFDEGFIGRTIFVYSDEPRPPIPFPYISPEERKLKEALVTQLRGISEIRGEFLIDKHAKDLYSNWYEQRNPSSESEVASGFYEREHIHVLKMAMVFALSSGSGLSIAPQHIDASIELMVKVRASMGFALIGSGFSESTQHYAIVSNEMKKNGGLPIARSLLMKKLGNRMVLDQMDGALDWLEQTGKVHRTIKGEGRKATTYYTWVGKE